MADSNVKADALARILHEASVRLDDAVGQLKAVGVPVDNLKRLKRSLEDNNTTCNTGCTCGGGGGGGGGGGNCVAVQ